MQPQRAIYDAAYHCLECARQRWGDDIGFDESLKDSEGNTPSLVMDYDGEWWETANQPDVPVVQVLECDTCHTIIDVWIDEDRCREIGYARGRDFGLAQVDEWCDNLGYRDELIETHCAPDIRGDRSFKTVIADALISMASESEDNDHHSADYVNGEISDVIRAGTALENTDAIDLIDEAIAEGIETTVRDNWSAL